MTDPRIPRYPSDADYTTNSPSYYDDLARKQHLLEILSNRIYAYDKTLDNRLATIDEALANFITVTDGKLQLVTDKIGEGFNTEINALLSQWLIDGTLEHIINVEIFNSKADQIDMDKIHQQSVSSVKARPLFTVMDDDGHADVHGVLKDYLTTRGIKGCVAQPSDFFSDNGHTDRISISQLKELHDVHGWEVLSHGIFQVQLNDLSETQVRKQLKDSKEELIRLGFDVKHFCYGYGIPEKWVQEIVKDYYPSGVNAQPEANNGKGVNTVPIMQYNVSRIPFGAYSNYALSEMKQLVDWTLQNNGWLIIETHISVTPEEKRLELQQLLDYILEKSGEFVTYDEGFQVFGNDINKGIYGKDLEEDNYFMLTKTGQVHQNTMGSVVMTTPPVRFPKGFSAKSFLSNGTSGFPSQNFDGVDSRGGGELITFISSKDPSLSYQIFMPIPVERQDILIRNARNDNEWREFTSFNRNRISPRQYPASTLCANYPKDEITVYMVRTPNNIGYPHNRPGMVKVYNFSHTERGFGKRIFYSHNSEDTFIQTEKSDGTWNAWKQIGMTLLV